MKNDNSYQIIIYLIIFLFIKSIIDLIYEIKNPKSNKVNENDILAKNLANIEYILNIVTIVLILLLFIFYKLNTLLKSLLIIILISIFEYFIVNKRYIYLFIEQNNLSDKIIKFLDLYFDKFQIFMLMIFSLYCLTIILF